MHSPVQSPTLALRISPVFLLYLMGTEEQPQVPPLGEGGKLRLLILQVLFP